MISSNDNGKPERISEVRALYKRSDALYPGNVLVDKLHPLSSNGQSIMNDIEYYLQHPNHRRQFEDIFFECLSVFAELTLQEK